MEAEVQGVCCPLQQRPNSGRLTLLSSFNRRHESRAPLASRYSIGNKLEIVHEGGLHLEATGEIQLVKQISAEETRPQ
ncbi:hypothetical protein CHARACLAT_026837 [Characodon lateralis]|uniref:Uncharacterized protein n=1 Tax=Characodon lateralis TaxID=208331 RepID=A0ABU7DUH7_9TELE|nr:hypothetical protein [Characodon lateralis]